MDFTAQLDAIEDKYYDEWEEDRGPLVKSLVETHQGLRKEPDNSRKLMLHLMDRFGGAYIPYLFWDRMDSFLDTPDEDRHYLHKLIQAFCDSSFEVEEQRKIKPLLVVYFNQEKEFEINKLKAQVIDKVHPTVKEFFTELTEFSEKNPAATKVYNDKFMLLRKETPDFELFGQPLSKLRIKILHS
ncbi:MAG: hypothetical protein AAGI38_23475 [Bacteroidota bacterium]